MAVSMVLPPAAAIALTALLVLEHTRLPKPSDLVCLYLVSSILCDAISLTLPPSNPHPAGGGQVATLARCVGYSLLLVLEHFRPHAVLRDPDSEFELSPEERSSLLSRAFFSWINPFLNKGYNNLILDEELPPLGKGLKPELTRAAMLQAWEQRGLSISPCSFGKKLTWPHSHSGNKNNPPPGVAQMHLASHGRRCRAASRPNPVPVLAAPPDQAFHQIRLNRLRLFFNTHRLLAHRILHRRLRRPRRMSPPPFPLPTRPNPPTSS